MFWKHVPLPLEEEMGVARPVVKVHGTMAAVHIS